MVKWASYPIGISDRPDVRDRHQCAHSPFRYMAGAGPLVIFLSLDLAYLKVVSWCEYFFLRLLLMYAQRSVHVGGIIVKRLERIYLFNFL
jgi:hypothetical protein